MTKCKCIFVCYNCIMFWLCAFIFMCNTSNLRFLDVMMLLSVFNFEHLYCSKDLLVLEVEVSGSSSLIFVEVNFFSVLSYKSLCFRVLLFKSVSFLT